MIPSEMETEPNHSRDRSIAPGSAVVTGGAGELGSTIAGELRAMGWTCHAPSRADLDVTSAASVEGFFRGVKDCTLLVNCAGIARDGLLARMDESTWDEVMEVDFRGAVRCARAVLPGMLRFGGGTILSVGSFSALAGAIGQTNYAAAKAALIGWTRSLAWEYGPKNIRANVILPGFLDTKMTRDLPEPVKQRALVAHALGRFTSVAESARAIAFLATCTHISGQILNLDSRIGDWG